MENIVKIFNSEDQAEIKKAFKEIIVEQFKTDMEERDFYMFDPDAIEEMINESFCEAIDEVKIEFKEKMREQMLNLLESNDIEKLLALKKKIK